MYVHAQATLQQMQERGLQVSNISFTTVMKSLVNENRVDDATKLLADMHSLKVSILVHTHKTYFGTVTARLLLPCEYWYCTLVHIICSCTYV
jgi:pentatricopeptide repeat protein